MRLGSVLMLAGAAMSLTACASTQLGGGSSFVTGSAGQSGNAKGESEELVSCEAPLGTVALVESQSPALAQAGLESPLPLIRLMASQSGCFTVVERGQALTRMQDERALASGGLLQQGSNVGGAQVVAADYFLTPNVTFSDSNAGALGGALGSLLPSSLGGLAAGLQFRDAESVLTVTDTRTGVQVAIAQGSARTTDLGGLGLGGVSGFGGLGGGYSSTDEGKVVAAAFLDAFNNLVYQIRALAPTG
jgi:hypothetical protein